MQAFVPLITALLTEGDLKAFPKYLRRLKTTFYQCHNDEVTEACYIHQIQIYLKHIYGKQLMISLKSNGFTLIEALVTVALISILSSFAFSNYKEQMVRGKLMEATKGLTEAQMRLEQRFQDARTYLNYVKADCSPENAAFGTIIQPSQYFSFECTTTDMTYSITAKGKASGGMKDYVLTVDQDRQKSSLLPGMSSPQPCWISKAGETC